jgi:ribonuclease Z
VANGVRQDGGVHPALRNVLSASSLPDGGDPLQPFPERLTDRHPFRQWKTWTMPGTGLTLTGYSRANDKTFFHVPELRCGLDAGLVEGRQVETVLLTHAHLDHAKDLDFLAAREAGVDIFLPAELMSYVVDYLRATTELNRAARLDPPLAPSARLHGVRPGEEHRFGRRGQYAVRVVGCRHKVPCVGYGVAAVKKVLTPEFDKLRTDLTAGGRGAEFGRIVARERDKGERVELEVRQPLFAYLGDTDPSVFTANPWLFEYPVIVTECTYLDDSQLERAAQVGHTVWSQLRPVIRAHPQTVFVVTHFSLRHTDRDIVAFFDKELDGEHLDNVVAWAHREP